MYYPANQIKKTTQQVVIVSIVFLQALISANAQNIGINSDGSNPESNTMLDVKSAGTTSSTFGLRVKDFSNTNLMVVRSDGRVGLGTTIPTHKLTIMDGSLDIIGLSNQGIFLEKTGSVELARSTGDAFIDFKSSTTEDFDARLGISGNGFHFLTGGNGTTSTRMAITSSGNVGMGTTAPDNSAVLELSSTDQGFLITRSDTGNISSPVMGLMTVHPGDTCLYMYSGIRWISFGGAGCCCLDGGDCTDPNTTTATSNPCTPESGYTGCRVYTMSESDQTFIIPNCATTINIKCWGAGGGGGGNSANYNIPGGAGAFAEADFPTSSYGGSLTVVVGEGGDHHFSQATAAAYGFGGQAVHDGQGGGLSGVFNGTVTQGNAMIISGGGGGASGSVTDSQSNNGGHGNAGDAGGAAGMTGTSATSNNGAGAGGYNGGTADLVNVGISSYPAGRGGTSYTDGNATSVSLVSPTVYNAAANSSDPHYVAGISLGGQTTTSDPGGNGTVVIQW